VISDMLRKAVARAKAARPLRKISPTLLVLTLVAVLLDTYGVVDLQWLISILSVIEPS
jgi:hypothetical protein